MILLVNGEPLGSERINNVKSYVSINNFKLYVPINALTAVGALMTLLDFTLSNARRFYSSMGNCLAVKGSTTSNAMSPLSTLLFLVSFCFQLSFSSPPTSRITSYTVHYQTATNIATVRLMYEQCLYDFKPTPCISILYA